MRIFVSFCVATGDTLMKHRTFYISWRAIATLCNYYAAWVALVPTVNANPDLVHVL